MSSCLIRFSNIIKCDIYEFDDYYYNEEDNYIYGIFDEFDLSKCKDREKIHTTIDNEKVRILSPNPVFSSPKLLSSLISLRNKLPNFKYFHKLTYLDCENIEYIEKQLLENKNSTKYINLILNWCRKNGNPFVGDIKYNSYFTTITNSIDYSCYGFRNDFDYFLHTKNKKYKFRLGVFLIGLDILYNTFILGVSLKKEELLNSNCSDYIYKYINNLPTLDYENIKLEKKRELINTYFKSMRIHLKTELDENNNLSHYLYGDTLFSSAMYQLMLFLGYTNNKVAICKGCSNLYIDTRKNRRFCSDRCRQSYHRNHPKE